jgi:carboxyl-terminal processing protease
MTGPQKFLLGSAAVILLSVLIALAYSQDSGIAASPEDREEFQRLVNLYSIVEQNYFTEFDVKDAFSGALNGMLNQLDPHSTFIDAGDYALMEERYRGDYQGIGVSFIMFDDKITVMDVIRGGPSDRVGVHMGDQIVEIEGQSAIGMDSNEVQDRLRGPDGTKVAVKIERPHHDTPVEITITRGQIPIASVENSFMLDSHTGYIRIALFGRKTGIEVENELENLSSQGMDRLVLDLRGNTGGYLDTSIQVADKFLPGRRLIVYTDGRARGSHERFFSPEGNKYWDLPLVVLIDHLSASASEIVSGALQDWDRAVIAGQTSFGKGLVQTGFRLTDGSQLLLTTSHYYTPSGRLIQRNYKGIDLETYQVQGYFDYNPDDFAVKEVQEKRPVFLTATGRTVYGGGGISPDDPIDGELMFDPFIYSLNNSLLTFLYGRDYYWRQPDAWSDFDRFTREFKVSDKMLSELLELAKQRDFIYYPRRGQALSEVEMEKRYWELADQLRIFLKAEIAQFYFDRNAGFIIRTLTRDQQLAGARELFGEAEKLAAGQKDIKPDTFAARSNPGEDNE